MIHTFLPKICIYKKFDWGKGCNVWAQNKVAKPIVVTDLAVLQEKKNLK